MEQKDLARIRELAKEQLEIANKPQRKVLAEERTAINDGNIIRPMITVELGTFAEDVLPQLMQCETAEVTSFPISSITNISVTIPLSVDHIPVSYGSYFKPFDIDVTTQNTDGVGHHFISVISDLEEDFDKLKKFSFGVFPKEDTLKYADEIDELIGDILPAKLTGSSLYAVPTQNIVHIMSMEDMYIAHV